MKPLCVLGILDTPKGNEIAAEMMEWLQPLHEVHKVYHDGTQYEYPALQYAQELSKDTGRGVLYLHTKGAVNKPERSRRIRNMWRELFGDSGALPTIEIVNATVLSGMTIKIVLCPFTGIDRMTRYNGFYATAGAWAAIPEIQPNKDRMVFEKLFRHANVTIVGLLHNNIGHDNLGEMHEILERYK